MECNEMKCGSEIEMAADDVILVVRDWMQQKHIQMYLISFIKEFNWSEVKSHLLSYVR